jgi:hypothetical protein
MSNQPGSRSLRHSVNGIAAHVRSGSFAFSCQVEEISTKGAFLRTDQLLSAGAVMEIDLAKPGGRKMIHTFARVLRACGRTDGEHPHPGLDVDFTSIGYDDSGRLLTWLDELAHQPAPTSRIPTVPVRQQAMAAAKDVEQAPLATAEPMKPMKPSEHAKLMLQVKGLLLEMDDLRFSVRTRDEEIERLRRQLEVAEQLIGKRTNTK